ncbi:MAG: VCBS repeat-containing protein [Verrucomicrobiae bacterium]|nr:VCBS repeat-containing protein [Verrucomicrobiae bacterium]
MKTRRISRGGEGGHCCPGFSFPLLTSALAAGWILLFWLGGARLASAAEHLFVRVDSPGLLSERGNVWPLAWGDYDGDGYLDLYVPLSGPDWTPAVNRLYRNNGDGTFTLRTAEDAGPIVSDRDRSVGAFWGDVNNDGRLDLLVQVDVYSDDAPKLPLRLYLNHGGGRFGSVLAGALSGVYRLPGWGNLCDYDGDGWLDAFMGGDGRDPRDRYHMLFHGRGDAAFDRLREGELATQRITNGYANNSLWTDIDGDGDPDLLVANVGTRAHDFVYRNDGRGTFTRLTNSILETPNHRSFHIISADLDNDGDIDIVSAGDTTRIYLNDGAGNFTLSQDLIAYAGPKTGDYDNDGDVDLLLWAGEDVAQLYRNDGTGRFESVEEAFTVKGWLDQSPFVDYDNDGFLDAAGVGEDGTAWKIVLFRNQGNGNHWIKFRLTGTASNRSAIGAKVRVKATLGGQTVWQMRELFSWVLAEDGLRAHFGLGDATVVEEVRIEWPSGNTTTLTDLSVNQIVDVTESAWIRPARPVVTVNGAVSMTNVVSALSRQWYFDGQPLEGQTEHVLTLTNVQPRQAGRYSVVCQTAGGTETYYVYVRVLDHFTKVVEGEIATEEFGNDRAIWFDMDRDGWLDVFIPNDYDVRGLSDSLFRNLEGQGFVRVTDSPVTVRPIGSPGGAAADYDNDGWPDLFITRAGTSDLFRNLGGGQFVAVPAPYNLPSRQGYGSSWGDYDRDGHLDLLVAYSASAAVDREGLYRNNGDGTFTGMTAALVGSLLAEDAHSWDCSWRDIDQDGWPDALYGNLSGLRLHRNLRDGSFSRVASASLDRVQVSASFAWGDFDQDGDLDLFVTCWSSGPAGLYRNQGDFQFERVVAAGDLVGSQFAVDSFPAWGDYDNDGYLDLFVAVHDGTRPSGLYRNRGDGTFQRVDAGDLLTAGERRLYPVWVDVDNNGFLDLFIPCGDVVTEDFPPVRNPFFLNSGNGNSWLKVRLIGTTSNRDGIGAKIRVQATVAGRTLTQMTEVNGENGAPLLAHFGLGDAVRATSVRIEWPSGIVQKLANVGVNQTLTVTEPERIRLTFTPTAEGLRVTCHGLPNTRYVLQRSSDLKTWSTVSGLPDTDTDGAATAVVYPGTDGSRFFRVYKP